MSFFAIAKGNGFSGPIQLHFEYPEFGGVELGEKTLKIPKERFVAMIGRDTQRIRSAMKQAGLV